MGKTPSRTNVNSHPFTNATMRPEIAIAITYKTSGILSLNAPWKAIVSAENCDDNSAWLIESNHPISCLSKLLRYCFLH